MVAEMKAPTGLDIGQNVFLHLKSLSELNEDDLKVKTDGEIITLEGFVRSRDEKRTAEKAALEVPGVKAVANEIVVKPPVERPDTEILRDILREFRANILIPVNQVKVIVSDCRVTLEGMVHSQFEKLLAGAAMKRVRGVKGIENNIEVKAEAVDPEIAGEEEDTLALINSEGAWTELGAAEAG